ncbi:N-6 DNA methylase [Psychromonas arctica]|uniref:site-specific DNA-methyltransferase (adenine-specific) n=1 Tax=Psychromonas arctica TaxID=168275 RepID=A0ABU9HDP1_9GAMM
MAKEAATDIFVHGLLTDAGIAHEVQGSDIKEIKEALKSASKRQTGFNGSPEFIAVVKDFLIVIENKKDKNKHVKYTDSGVLDKKVKSLTDYAMNGAWSYGKHLADNTSYKKVIAFGIAGDEKRHVIQPMYIDETNTIRILPEVETFINFNEKNIDEYYTTEILKIETKKEKNTKELIKFAKSFHEDLRNYGKLGDKNKPLVVSGILLALKEQESKQFSIDMLGQEIDSDDEVITDGQIIYSAIEKALKRSRVSPEVKRDKLLNQFDIIRDNTTLNLKDTTLGETPLKYFAKQLNEHLYEDIRYNNSSEDYLGRFYGEFMSYSGGDGQSLGIILTPKHITELFCDLIEIKADDVILDPCCGTGGFLIAAMHAMLKQANDSEKRSIKQKQLHGYEIEDYMFSIATTNMILRGDGKSNLIDTDFLKLNTAEVQDEKIATIGMINPPYSMGSSANPDLYEINFIKHLLDSLAIDGKCIAIVPQSTMMGKSNDEFSIKQEILKKHTLEGVITLNTNTFYGVGTLTCLAIFTAHQSHPEGKESKFISFEDDGYKVAKHIGLLPTSSVIDRKKHLLDVWFERKTDETNFIVKTNVEAEDEWLHSFYYFNDELPNDDDFNQTVADYLTFQTDMLLNDKGYLFDE